MKTFEQVVDELFKPKKPRFITWRAYRMGDQNIIDKKYHYSKEVHKLLIPFYGADIDEPVLKICKRILNKPERFRLVSEKYKEVESLNTGMVERKAQLETFTIVDKDTGHKFVSSVVGVKYPTCLSKDEKILLSHCVDAWYMERKDTEHEKKTKREQKRKDKFRQELTDLYKDL